MKSSSGVGNEELLLKSDVSIYPTDWSSDGRFILFDKVLPKTQSDIWALPLLGDRKPFSLIQTDSDESHASLSPDEHWIAYTSNESGKYEIYVQPFPSGGTRWQISTNGGEFARWRGDGKELFYLSLDQKMMAVEVTQASNTLEAGGPKVLFPTQIGILAREYSAYDVTPDGQQFMISSLSSLNSGKIRVVLNWASDLKR